MHAIFSTKAKRVLDVGCGEGWLVRRLREVGIRAYGVDGSAELIHLAARHGRYFHCLTYGEIIAGAELRDSPFDCIAINFALFDQHQPLNLLHALKIHLEEKGTLVIQSLYPRIADGNGNWKQNALDGLPERFVDGHPWYDRTLEEWNNLFSAAGWQLDRQAITRHPMTEQPCSMIFFLKK
ncbi:MAG: class I SAM-dependent methyltransferase [Bacteroidota bacterium]